LMKEGTAIDDIVDKLKERAKAYRDTIKAREEGGIAKAPEADTRGFMQRMADAILAGEAPIGGGLINMALMIRNFLKGTAAEESAAASESIRVAQNMSEKREKIYATEFEKRAAMLSRARGRLNQDVNVAEDEKNAWKKAYEEASEAMQQYYVDLAAAKADAAQKAENVKMELLINVDSKQAAGWLVGLMAASEKSREALEQELASYVDKARALSMATKRTGLSPEGEKQRAIDVAKEQDAIASSMRGVRAELDKNAAQAAIYASQLDRASNATGDLREAMVKSFQDMVAARQATMGDRAFQKQLKEAPKAAEAFAQQQLALADKNAKAAGAAYLKAIAAAEKDPTKKEEAEKLFAALTQAQEGVYKWQDNLVAAGEALQGSFTALAEKSIGFWGSQNPLEMLGGGAVKVDQKLLVEAVAQTKVLGSIDGKLSKLYGHFY